MSPDELRALADALERLSLGTGKIGKAADYLRACADPKPVAWQYRWKGSRELHYTLSDPAERDTQEIIDVQPLYSAPVAPQAEPKREPLSYDERWWVSAIEPLIVLRRIDAAKLGAIADADQQGKLMIKTRLRAIADCIHALHRAHSAQPVQAMGTGATGNATNAEQGSTAHAGEMPAKLSAPSDDPIRRAEAAMGFPSNSCLSSRHAASIAETLIKYGTCPMLANDPVLCGKSILETVAELWETRAARDELRRQLAESKREPLSDDWIIDTANAINAALPFDTDEQAGLLQIARAVERAHGIGGSDAE